MSLEELREFYEISSWTSKWLTYITIINLIFFIPLTLAIVYGVYLYWKNKK
jgi:hypothetical protein